MKHAITDDNKVSQSQIIIASHGQKFLTKGRIAPAPVSHAAGESILSLAFAVTRWSCGQVCIPVLLRAFAAYTV